MAKKELTPIDHNFLESVAEILTQARKNAKTAVNLSMVYAYFEIGRMIVEEEQHGANRAAYGTQLLKELSAYLTEKYGKGFSVGNLKNIRQFYKVYANDQIGETVFSQFENLPAVSTGRKFFLSWSHYLKLMRITNIDERHFYEIEAVKNDWSLNELKRHCRRIMRRFLPASMRPFCQARSLCKNCFKNRCQTQTEVRANEITV